jgi:hypothetical protein
MFWWGNLKERDVDGRIILSWIFRMWEGRAWTRSIVNAVMNFGFHKMRGVT